MVKKAALLAAILVLQAGMLAGCTSNEQAAQSAQSQTETQAQQTQNLSVQSTVEQTAAQQQGSVQFADAGELSRSSRTCSATTSTATIRFWAALSSRTCPTCLPPMRRTACWPSSWCWNTAFRCAPASAPTCI